MQADGWEFNKIEKMDIKPVDAPAVPEDFHTKLRQRFFAKFSEVEGNKEAFKSSLCLFKGIVDVPKNNEDTNHVVQQESTFWYLFGVKESNCYAAIENDSGDWVLFVPRLEEAYQMWMYVKPVDKFKSDYKANKILFVDQLQDYLKQKDSSQIYVFSGTDSDSKLDASEPEDKYLHLAKSVDRETLWTIICNLRVVKTEDEIHLMRYVCKVATDAHIKVMKSAKHGLKQLQMHALFHFEHTIRCGCEHMAFSSICSSGRDCATLHYIENDKIIEEGQMLLHDMGGKWHGYCADQAITFPVDGKFTEKQKKIYVAVYEAQKAVLEALRPGVSWGDMHLLAEKIILEHLMDIGIVKRFPMEELVEKRIGAIFFPHGLGHLLGLRVHDVGGYTDGPKRSEKAGLRSLRTLRTMEEGTIMTVEPGCYFIEFLIKNSLADPETAKYLDEHLINEYKEVGGVRLEDNVVIRKDGPEMLSFLPRKWQEVEKVLAEP